MSLQQTISWDVLGSRLIKKEFMEVTMWTAGGNIDPEPLTGLSNDPFQEGFPFGAVKMYLYPTADKLLTAVE